MKIRLLSPAEIDKCDIVLVNADSRIALSWWSSCRAKNGLVVPLMLSKNDLPTSRIASIRRPLRIESVISSIQQIFATQTSESVGDVGIADAMRVLVVDDSYPVRQYMGHTLHKLLPGSMEICFAASGEEAMAVIWDRPFDIVFLDVVMPGMDGYKVCKAIKSEQFASVIMLTSRKSPFDKVRGRMSGCDAFLTKPPDLDELKILLADFMDTTRADCAGGGVGSAVSGSIGVDTKHMLKPELISLTTSSASTIHAKGESWTHSKGRSRT